MSLFWVNEECQAFLLVQEPRFLVRMEGSNRNSLA